MRTVNTNRITKYGLDVLNRLYGCKKVSRSMTIRELSSNMETLNALVKRGLVTGHTSGFIDESIETDVFFTLTEGALEWMTARKRY